MNTHDIDDSMSQLAADAAAAMAMSGKPTGFSLHPSGPANTCTECQWSDACGVLHPNPGMLAEDKDGWFCIRCGHPPECHKQPIACEVCNGSGGIASACRCPCGGAE